MKRYKKRRSFINKCFNILIPLGIIYIGRVVYRMNQADILCGGCIHERFIHQDTTYEEIQTTHLRMHILDLSYIGHQYHAFYETSPFPVYNDTYIYGLKGIFDMYHIDKKVRISGEFINNIRNDSLQNVILVDFGEYYIAK